MRSPSRVVLPTALASLLALGVPALGSCHEPEGVPPVPPHPTDPTNASIHRTVAQRDIDMDASLGAPQLDVVDPPLPSPDAARPASLDPSAITPARANLVP